MELVGLILAVHRSLDRAAISHAFGGALALAYVAAPRGTVDIDVNVFIGPERLDEVTAAFTELRLDRTTPAHEVPIAGVRYERAGDPFPVDVFPSLDERYANAERRRVMRPFAGASLPFLSAEDLCVFKLSFGRPQDWVDLAAIAATTKLDLAYVEDQLIALRGPTMYPSMTRLRRLVRGNI